MPPSRDCCRLAPRRLTRLFLVGKKKGFFLSTVRLSDVALGSHTIRRARCPRQRSGPLSASRLSAEMKKPPTTEMAQCVSTSDSETERWGRHGGGVGGLGGRRGWGGGSETLAKQRGRVLFQNTTALKRFVLGFNKIYFNFFNQNFAHVSHIVPLSLRQC